MKKKQNKVREGRKKKEKGGKAKNKVRKEKE